MKMVRIYSVDNCPYCNELKSYLKKDDIEFIDVNVNRPEHEEEFKKLFEVTKCNDVPMVKIGNQLLVPNVSFKSINEAHLLVKKLLV